MNELNEKQKIFVSEYLKDFNGTRAYKVAYGVENEKTAASNAWRTLRNADIQKAIQAKANQQLDEIDVDVAYIINGIKEVTERCKTPDIDGKIDASNSLKGFELLGKYKNIFKENVDLNVKDSKKLKDVFSQMGGEGLDE